MANEWPAWRGPNGDGKLIDAESYPQEWSSDKNRKWRIDLPSPGNSSPIVVGGKLFLTTAENEGQIRTLLCYDTKDGKLLWQRAVDYGKKDKTHKTNPFSAASPTSDGEHVYAWHGNAGLYAYDLDGNKVWTVSAGKDYAHIWGPNAASPVIHGDAIILHAGPGLAARILALDLKTGKMLWKKELPESASEKVGQFKGSWATPLLIQNGNRSEILLGLPGFLTSFDPGTGEELWRCSGLTSLAYTNVLAGPEHLVYLSGFGGPGIGVRLPAPDETGDITDSHQTWAEKGKKPNRQRIGSGQMIGDHIYQLDEPGIMVCLEVATGKKLWEERMSRKSWSSMNQIGDKLYVNDDTGTTFVIQPDPSGLQLLHKNSIDPNQHTNSSLAFANGVIYQRTDSYLYAFEK